MAGNRPPTNPSPLYEHALRLHRLTPHEPLPRSGEPYPDAAARRRRRQRHPPDGTLGGLEAARVLDEYFADPSATLLELACRLRSLPVPYRHNERVAEAARRAPGARSRETGRWLVRHGTDAAAVAAGLAVLAEVATSDDIPRIQTVGLLSNGFGALAVHALDRLPGGVDALIWLAERVTAWGRVHAVDALCRHVDDHPAVRPWLLRRALDGDFLNSYFADTVARVTVLHEAVAESGADAEVVDKAGRILHVMTYCEGRGTSLRRYPHAVALMEAHLPHLRRLGPTTERCFAVASVAHYLTLEAPLPTDDVPGVDEVPGIKERWDEACASYLALIDRTEWCEVARRGLVDGDQRLTWVAAKVAGILRLRALAET
ncbi:hypothetical protein [Streptomyces sp. ID05-47C]|uniref:hypothetical protein n=1 Tax=Streptomyces sp. ID05-47C TaxID=3028665 RepID=UPI0029A326BC|nr:hypothetical protein [Streptomyces sp. ID05-47C]MDX3571815.1 hypothetical protein [Streptomyces sp. ID05-47C]